MINRKVIAWALYDWANSAFALSVLAVLFPIFLGNYWSAGDSGATVTARLGFITAGAALVVSLLAPVLGAIADSGGYRKRFLILIGSDWRGCTAALALPGQGEWPWALALYLIASIGFYGSTVFYDSLLVDVAESGKYHFVSTLGYSLGYLGGALLLALHLWMLNSPATFGMSDGSEVIRFAFVSVGAWWAIFANPTPHVCSGKPQCCDGFSAYHKSRISGTGINVLSHSPVPQHCQFSDRLLAVHRRSVYRDFDGRKLRSATRLRRFRPCHGIHDYESSWLSGDPFVRVPRAEVRCPVWHLRGAGNLRGGVELGGIHDGHSTVLRHGHNRRMYSGWCAGSESLVLRDANPERSAGRVLRFLQHDDQIFACHWAGRRRRIRDDVE